MLRIVCLTVVCGMLTGCQLFPSAATVSTFAPLPTQGVRPTEVAALPPGSKVEILWQYDTSRTRTVGEVLHASPQGVALINARIEARHESGTPVMSRVPYVNRLFKNTGVGVQAVPVQWVSILQMTTATVITPPPEGYVAPQLAIDTQEGLMFERIGLDFDFPIPDGDGEIDVSNVQFRQHIEYAPANPVSKSAPAVPDFRKSAAGN